MDCRGKAAHLKFEFSVHGTFKITSSRIVHDLSYEQKAVVWLRVVYPPLLSLSAE